MREDVPDRNLFQAHNKKKIDLHFTTGIIFMNRKQCQKRGRFQTLRGGEGDKTKLKETAPKWGRLGRHGWTTEKLTISMSELAPLPELQVWVLLSGTCALLRVPVVVVTILVSLDRYTGSSSVLLWYSWLKASWNPFISRIPFIDLCHESTHVIITLLSSNLIVPTEGWKTHTYVL